MVKGRPVRSCTKNPVLYADFVRKDVKYTNRLNNGYSERKAHITDYFQQTDVTEDQAKGKCHSFKVTQINTHCLENFEVSIGDIISCEQSNGLVKLQPETDSCRTPLIKKTINMTLNGVVKSPPTPHRITLCTDVKEHRLNGEDEVKNFQKPIVAPKARRKLNNNRLHILNDNHLTGSNHKLTDYFPVRRSVRKTKTTVLEEKQRCLEKALRANVEDGLKISYFEGKGRGIVADKPFRKGEYVVEYSGDLIDIAEAKKREEMYAMDQNMGCYMYYFKHNNQQYCIDATPESDKLGRLVNHSRNGNLVTRTICIDGKPRLVLIAKDDIQVGEEILYDYGDRSKESLKHHPWLAN